MASARVPRSPLVERTTDHERLWRKQRLALAFRIFGRFGFDEGVAGHITARDPEHHDRFWVNPFGMSFKQITVDDLILVDHHGDVVEGTWPVNRAAFAIHSSIHQARPDVIAAAHSHSKFGRAFSTLGRTLEPLTQDSCIFYGDHALFDDYTGVVNDPEEGKRIAHALGGNKAAILRNHGLLTVGQSVEEAIFWYVTMERTCEVELLARAAGEVRPIEPEAAARVHADVGSHAAGWFCAQPIFDWIAEVEPGAFGTTHPVD
jgi:ribulose-5-phosphate 4-epimerase/fuculose-1-phosphate aldolase